MKERKKKNSLKAFRNEEIKKQEIIKGGPKTSRGTETTVQEAGGNV